MWPAFSFYCSSFFSQYCNEWKMCWLYHFCNQLYHFGINNLVVYNQAKATMQKQQSKSNKAKATKQKQQSKSNRSKAKIVGLSICVWRKRTCLTIFFERSQMNNFVLLERCFFTFGRVSLSAIGQLFNKRTHLSIISKLLMSFWKGYLKS